MKATISPKLLTLVFASSLLLGMCVQAAAPIEDSDEATFTTIDFPGATLTVAIDINPAGETVGDYVSAGNTHGFLRSKNGEFTTVDFPGSVFTLAAGINPRGDIVGQYRLPSDPLTARHGFLLSNGEFTTIDPTGSIWTNVLGINPRGDIVGRYCTLLPCNSATGNIHGYLLSEGEFTTIDFPDAIRTAAWKINPRGQILGGYTAADGQNHVFLLSEGEFTTIDFSGAILNGLDNGGINPRGDIVGFYCDTAPCIVQTSRDKHGFLLSRSEFTTIDFPGALDTAAFAINARGDIVGPYDDTSGKTHGFLLSRRHEDENIE